MKKLLWSVGVCLAMGACATLMARSWARAQALRAIESATKAKVRAQAFKMELLAGRVSLPEVTLTPESASSLVEKATVANVCGTIRWCEWSSGMLPMEVTLVDCVVTLRQGGQAAFLKEHSPLTQSQPPTFPASPENSQEPRRAKIVLTELSARNITIVNGANQPALASGVDCSARRALEGWQGKVTAESMGMESFPLTHVQLNFSTEPQGARLAEFRCNLKEGTISGSGWCSNDGTTALDLQVASLQLKSATPAWCGNAISGIVSGGFTYKGDATQWRNGTLTGSFALKDGALKLAAASPFLSMLGVATSDGSLQLDAANASLALTPEHWTLSQIGLKKAGLLEIKGALSCNHEAKLKADLDLGISSKFPLGAGQPTVAEGQPFAADAQGGNLKWIPLHFETAPDQLWQGILAALLTPAPAESTQPASAKPALQEKAKAAMSAVLNLLKPAAK